MKAKLQHTPRGRFNLRPRSGPFLIAGLLAISSLSGQQVINYSNGDNRVATVDTDPPNDPTRLRITSGSAEQSGDVSGTGVVVKRGDGRLELSGTNTYSGGTRIREGTLVVTSDANLGAAAGEININGGRLRVNESFTTSRTTNLNGIGGDIAVRNNRTLFHDGLIQGTGPLTKRGNGSLEITGANTYSGGTLLSRGTLVIANDDALGTGSLFIEDGTTLATPDAFLPFTSYALNNDVFVQGDFNVSPNGQFVLLSSFDLNGNVNLTGDTRTITNLTENGPMHFGGVISNGGLTLDVDFLNTSGYFQFKGSQANTYTGDTTVGELATLTLNKDDNVTAIAGDVIIEDLGNLITLADEQIADDSNIHFEEFADMRIGLLSNVTETIGSLTDDGSGDALITLNGLINGSTLRVNTGDFSGDITGGGGAPSSISLEKYGPGVLTLSGFNDYRGDTLISGGVLQVSEDENLGNTGGFILDPSRILFDGGVLRITDSFETERDTVLDGIGGRITTVNNSVLTHDGEISGNGTLEKRGNGELRLTGTNTYTGRTEVSNGLLSVRDGGSINTTSNIVIAPDASDDAEFLVNGSGAGGSATTTGAFVAGRRGFADVVIEDGGTVEANGVVIGLGAPSFGFVEVDGAGSTLTATSGGPFGGEIVIGSRGIGALDIRNGGTVIAEEMTVGSFFSGEGGFRVRGTDSLLDIDGDLFLAEEGFGQGIVRNRGTVQVGGSAILAEDSGSFAELLIDGGDSSMTVESILGIGNEGDAIVRVRNFGALTSGTAVLGAEADGRGRVILRTGRWFIEDSPIIVGDEGVGELIINETGILDQSATSGAVTLGLKAGSTGRLFIGGRGAAPSSSGVLNVEEVTTGAGSGTIRFNTPDLTPTFFTRTGFSGATPVLISGGTRVVNDSGNTFIGGSNTFTGGTVINNGTVTTLSPSALGVGTVELNGEGLAVAGPLELGDDLIWNGGKIRGLLGTDFGGEFSRIDTTGDLLLNTLGEFELMAGTGFKNKTEYLLISTSSPLPYDPDADFLANSLFGLDPVFSIVGNDLFINYPGSLIVSGPVLQNSNPVNTPFFADFVVNGSARTGTTAESNEIRSLTFNSGSSLQVFNQLLVSDGIFAVPAGTGTISGGQLVTPGDFSKTGGGSLSINSLVSVGGNTQINGGGLIILGTLNTDDVNMNGERFEILGTVNAQGVVNLNGGSTIVNGLLSSNDFINVNAGRLGGTGVIRGNLNNFGGTVAPGNSIGTLTVDGNYVQSSGGTLEMEIQNPSIADRLNITGTALLAGTLGLEILGNGLSFGDVVTLITAQGGIGGGFDQITGVPSGFRARPWLTSGNTAYNLIFAPRSYTQVATTPNQTALARALDQWIGVGEREIAAATLQLDLLREAAYPIVFEAILPTIYGSLVPTTFAQSYGDGRTVNQQALFGLARLRAAALASGEEPEESAEVATVEGDTDSANAAQSQPVDHGWRVWADARGGYSTDDPLSLDSEGGTILAGADLILANNFVGGFYVGGQSQESRDSTPDFQSDGARFGLYGLLSFLENVYLSGVLGFGTTDVSVSRPIAFGGTASGDTEGMDWFTRIEAGYAFYPGGFEITPFVGLQYSSVEFDSFDESSDSVFALGLDDWGSDRWDGFVGADVAYPLPLEGQFVLLPYARLTLRDTFSQDDDDLNASLRRGTGPVFAFSPDEVNGDGFEYGGGLRLSAIETGWSVNLGFTGFSGDDGDFQQVNLGFSWDL